MKISIECGQCGKQYQVKPDLAGKRVKCQACNATIPVPAGAEAKGDAPKKAAAGVKTGSPAAKTQAGAPPAKKAPAAAAKAAAPPAAPQHSILDEAMAGAVRLPNPGEIHCPGCRAIIPATSVICVSCGFDLQSGRSTRVASEANRRKRRPGQMPVMGIFVALVSIFYGLAGAAFFATLFFYSFVVMKHLGLPTSENGESVPAMFGLPVHILLSTGGLLMCVSGIGIFRYSKGATLNAGLGAKIYVWTLTILLILSVGNTIYKSTARAKEAAAKTAAEAATGKEQPAPVDLGHAERLRGSSLMGLLTMGNLGRIIGMFLLLIAPPAFVWAWSTTQGRRWDWELPEPLHKLRLKPTAKVGGPQAPAEKK